jgi:pyruvate dehydrogenase complex dehydrogenase (E1) component
VPDLHSTDYINTIAPTLEPPFPGDEDVERRIRAHIRWNAAIMVHRAQRPSVGVGGHISTYAWAASLYEVGFNHFFRGHASEGGGDQIYFQGHASPGIYARAFLEGRLTEHQLDRFRQELSHPGGGLPSYPHPRLMPGFWQFPTVSMGLGAINAVYQARFNRCLHHRGITDTSRQRVWAFLGDGEMDEQHEDGHSLLLASTNPACIAYDAAFAFELGHIARDGLRRMYGKTRDGEDPNVFYYLTLYNEPITQPAPPTDVDVDGILAGMHRYRPADKTDGPQAQILASGIAVQWALRAQRLLRDDWGVAADVGSVTSWTQLRREALAVDAWNLAHPGRPRRIPYVTGRLTAAPGPVTAVCDWMRAVSDQIAPFVPGPWSSLGTDGFGRSDTRGALRRHFGVDAPSIVLRVLTQLADRVEIDESAPANAIQLYRLHEIDAAAAGNTEGSAE